MQFISCGRGHYYNPEEHATCPQCAREGTVQNGDMPMDSLGATEPVPNFQGGPSLGATEPVPDLSFGTTEAIGATEPIGAFPPTGGNTLNTAFFADTGANPVQGYTPTTFVSPEYLSAGPGSRQARIQPVVGWLVCVDGAAKGRDFRLHSQYNYIGRARHMDVCIEGDDTISSEKAAILAYDDQQKLFFFAPGQGRNLVRVNGRAVLNTVELQAYDRLTIGKSTLLFLPLCGERFDWNEQQA